MPNHTTPSDEELVRSAQMGRQDAFSQLYDRYLRSVYGRVRLKVPQDEVEDITQEIFIAVMRSLSSFQGRSKFSTWVWTLTSRKIADYYRTRKPQHVPSNLNDNFEHSSLLTQPNEPDDLLAVQSAIHKLPESYQEILMLRFVEDLSFEEIAQHNGQSFEAAKSHFRRAVDALRREMGPAHE